MKFFLTIYICSVLTQECMEVPIDKHDYKRFHGTHYSCVQKGLGESYAILFDGEVFVADQVEALELYARYMCEKVVDGNDVPKQDT